VRVNGARLVRAASWLAAALATLADAPWVAIVAEGNYCWSAFGFAMIAASLGVGMLAFSVVPAAVLYAKHGQRRDGVSLLVSACSLAAVLVLAA
jgi:hypothetical protein